MNAPYYFDYRNRQNWSVVPSNVHVSNSKITRYYVNYLLQKAMSVFKWKVPDEWALNYMLYSIYCYGYVAVINTDKFGVIPQHCTLSGYDVFYQPTHAVISNPHIKVVNYPRIGKDCTLIALQPNYGSIMDIVWNYAEQLAVAYETGIINMFNSKLSYIFFCNGKKGADSFKDMTDKINAGNPAVFLDKEAGVHSPENPLWTPFSQNVGANYIYSDIISDMRKIEAMFDTEIGIPNANTDKKERLITDEVNANNVETNSKCELWFESLEKGIEQTNKMFGVDISIDWRYKKEGEQNVAVSEHGESDDLRNV